MAIFREKEMILLDIIIHSARMPACIDNSAYLNIGFDKKKISKDCLGAFPSSKS